MENDTLVVNVNEIVQERISFRAYAPTVQMKDLRLSEKVRFDVFNESAKSVTQGRLQMIITIPANTILSEVAANDGVDFELKLIDDGEAMVSVELEVLRPLEERLIEFDIYFAGAMTSPSYKLDCSATLLINDLEVDKVAMDAILRLENPAVIG